MYVKYVCVSVCVCTCICVVHRLVSLMSDDSSSKELISEAVITLGSFAHGKRQQ